MLKSHLGEQFAAIFTCMQRRIRQIVPLLLMSLSLGLLLIFEGLWLKKAYDDAYQDLEEQTGTMFAHTVRDLEDSVFHRIFLEPLRIFSNDSIKIKVDNVKIRNRSKAGSWLVSAHDTLKSTDTVDRFSAFENRQFTLGKRLKHIGADTSIGVTIGKTSSRTWTEAHPSGSLSLFMALSGEDEDNKDVFTVFRDSMELNKLIFQGFEKMVIADKMNLGYKTIQISEQDSLQASGIIHSYTDIPSGQTYAVQLEAYEGYLLKKLLPQIPILPFSVFNNCIFILAGI